MLPERLISFVRASIKSVWALELLLFLQSHRERAWALPKLARELRASEAVVQASLVLFRAAGLVRDLDGGQIQFEPSSFELDNLVRELAETYRTHPSAVIDEIYAPESKLQHFADAFRLKKE